jgi:hypothetical protein
MVKKTDGQKDRYLVETGSVHFFDFRFQFFQVSSMVAERAEIGHETSDLKK